LLRQVTVLWLKQQQTQHATADPYCCASRSRAGEVVEWWKITVAREAVGIVEVRPRVFWHISKVQVSSPVNWCKKGDAYSLIDPRGTKADFQPKRGGGSLNAAKVQWRFHKREVIARHNCWLTNMSPPRCPTRG